VRTFLPGFLNLKLLKSRSAKFMSHKHIIIKKVEIKRVIILEGLLSEIKKRTGKILAIIKPSFR
jgi:hypothetical protein